MILAITIADEDAPRVTKAIGAYQNLKNDSGATRDATPEEITGLLTRYLCTAVQQQERQTAVAVAVAMAEASITPIQVTTGAVSSPVTP